MANGGLLLALLGAALLAWLVWAWRKQERWRAQARLRGLSGPAGRPGGASSLSEFLMTTLPAMGAALLPANEEERGRQRQRLIRAGFYDRQALLVFLGAKVILLALAAFGGLAAFSVGVLPLQKVGMAGCLAAGLAMLTPGLWLDSRRKKRLAALRRALPDALDMLVLCLEGGVSLHAALQRVTLELQNAHPTLATEMHIVQRELMLGQTAGEAMRKLANRIDLDDAHTLAAVLLQNERYGASMARALRIHSDTMRQQRRQRAEELAQKAAVKILFPTLLCIFPAIFIVILGPAAFQIMELFSGQK